MSEKKLLLQPPYVWRFSGEHILINKDLFYNDFLCPHLAIVDGDVATSAMATSTDTSTNSFAEDFHGSTVDGHLTAIAMIATTDASASIAARVATGSTCIDITAMDGDGVELAAVFSTANASGFIATVCLHFAVPDLDDAVGAAFASANACSVIATVCRDNTAIDGDHFTYIVETPLADTSATFSAKCGDRASIDGDGSNAALVVAAATCVQVVVDDRPALILELGLVAIGLTLVAGDSHHVGNESLRPSALCEDDKRE